MIPLSENTLGKRYKSHLNHSGGNRTPAPDFFGLQPLGAGAFFCLEGEKIGNFCSTRRES